MTERQLILISAEGDRLPAAVPFHNEGRTVAGWVVCWGLMLGAALVGVGLIAHLTVLTISGIVVGALSLVAGGALRAAGYGQPAPRSATEQAAVRA